MLKKIVVSILNFIAMIMRTIFKFLNIPAFVYDVFITKTLTKFAYYRIRDQMLPHLANAKFLLDVGTGTGEALYAIKNKIPQSVKVVGVDIDPYYIKKAKKIFEGCGNYEMRLQDYYDLEKCNEKYDIIIFTGSFMLMPDQDKALEIAKKILNPKGRIYFYITLYDKKKTLLEKVKPMIKHYTTIDFGKITYESQFSSLLEKNGINVLAKERIKHKINPLFHFFRVFMLECEAK